MGGGLAGGECVEVKLGRCRGGRGQSVCRLPLLIAWRAGSAVGGARPAMVESTARYCEARDLGRARRRLDVAWHRGRVMMKMRLTLLSVSRACGGGRVVMRRDALVRRRRFCAMMEVVLHVGLARDCGYFCAATEVCAIATRPCWRRCGGGDCAASQAWARACWPAAARVAICLPVSRAAALVWRRARIASQRVPARRRRRRQDGRAAGREGHVTGGGAVRW